MLIKDWTLLVAALAFAWAMYAIAFELARLRTIVTDRLSSIAEALWRIRDELTQLNSRDKGPS
jgi:hypothetical protein